MAKYSPKHLSPRRSQHLAPWRRRANLTRRRRLRSGLLVVLVLATVGPAMVAFGHAAGRSTTAGTPKSAPTGLAPSSTPSSRASGPVRSGLLPDASFEAGIVGWQAVAGARLGRLPAGRTGRWAATLTAGSGTQVGMTMPYVVRSRSDTVYTTQVWFRAARPGQQVEVRVLEIVGRSRFAADTVGLVLPDTRWRRIEVTHVAQQPGSRLVVELVVAKLDRRERVLIDDVQIDAKPFGV